MPLAVHEFTHVTHYEKGSARHACHAQNTVAGDDYCDLTSARQQDA